MLHDRKPHGPHELRQAAMTQAADGLVLRDIHPATAPAWWPPAPGWWGVVAVLAIGIAVALWLRARRRQRQRAIGRLFDDALAGADTPPARIAAMSELLRRAARRRDPAADRLQGDDWLQFLDQGLKQPVFAAGAGALLRDGGFRRDVSDAEVEGLRSVVRTRFLEWMVAKPVKPTDATRSTKRSRLTKPATPTKSAKADQPSKPAETQGAPR